MKAKLVYENINFERGLNPKAAMNLGPFATVKSWLEKQYSKGHGFMPYKYVINNLNDIRIFYDLRGDANENLPTWVFKYVEKPRFTFEEATTTQQLVSTHYYHYWRIYENYFYVSSDPDNIGFDHKYVSELEKTNENKEKVEVMVQALNKHFGNVPGLKLIEKRYES
jgi:hypothetical protein